MNRISVIILFGIVALQLSCSAPHDNPFDPESDNYIPPEDRILAKATATSMHFRTWANVEDQYWLIVRAQFVDAGVIDSVWVMRDSLWLGKLTPTGSDDPTHTVEINENHLYDMHGLLLQNLVGHDLVIHFTTVGGEMLSGDPFTLKRVLEDVPIAANPNDNSALTEVYPTLTWESYYSEFNFSYGIDVTHIAASGFRSAVYQFSGISASDTSHTVAEPLQVVVDPAYYYWTLKVTDDFGNIVRSLEAQFRIVEDE